MYYTEDKGKLCENLEYKEDMDNGFVIGLFTIDDVEQAINDFDIPSELLTEFFKTKNTKFESFDAFDLLSINILDYSNIEGRQGRVLIYLSKKITIFFGDHAMDTQKIYDVVSKCIKEGYTKSQALFDFFNSLTGGDREYFDFVEKEILDLEQALITSQKRDCVREIISLRKRLMTLKKYYEQWIDMLESLVENENGIIEHKTLRYFRILSGRIDRLFRNVLNLRDYVTQVRESYQAQVDISLNTTMKVFTVITTVFLPLTLIVGWYGMNLEMPEYSWQYGYSMVIAVSVLVVVAVFVYFKKMRWF